LSITICDLDNIKYCTNKYTIVFIFFLKIKNKKQAFAKIICKTYLANNLKTNILIKNNFINFKRIVINIVSKFVYIESCIVIVDLEVKTTCTIVYKQIYIKKAINVLFKLEITISIYYIFISSNRNFLFKLNKLNLLFYIYFINSNI